MGGIYNPILDPGTAETITAAWTFSGAVVLSGNGTVTGSLTFDADALHLADTDASHDLIITPGSNLTADRTITATTGDADVTLNVTATAAGTVLRSDGTNWAGSTLVLPNAATTGDIPYASAGNTLSMLADVAAGSYLRSGGVSTAPLWSTLILPNAITANQVVYGSATNTYGASANLTFNGNTLTATQGATGSRGSIFDAITGATVPLSEWQYNGAIGASMYFDADERRFYLGGNILTGTGTDLGNNVSGPGIEVANNTNAGTEGGAAGHIRLLKANGVGNYLWVDNSANPGVVRIHTAAPTGSAGTPTVADTAGSVVGGQSSWHELKDILSEHTDRRGALSAILKTKVYDFKYKGNSSYRDESDLPAMFTGLVIFPEDKSRWFAKNVGRQQVPALNEINAVGYFTLAIQELTARVAALEALR